MLCEALAQTRTDAGGLLTTAIGIACSAFGVTFVLNYRGWAERWYQSQAQRRLPAWLERIPPWKGSDPESIKPVMRIYVWFFAIVGPILVVVGVVRIVSGNL